LSIKKILENNNEKFKLFLPNIYLNNQQNKIKFCHEIKEHLSYLNCQNQIQLPEEEEQNGVGIEKIHLRKTLSLKQNNLIPNLTMNSYVFPSTTDVSDQQTFIWTIFLLIACVVLTLVFVDSIDYSADSLFIANDLLK
jgi:hypothetical protein